MRLSGTECSLCRKWVLWLAFLLWLFSMGSCFVITKNTFSRLASLQRTGGQSLCTSSHRSPFQVPVKANKPKNKPRAGLLGCFGNGATSRNGNDGASVEQGVPVLIPNKINVLHVVLPWTEGSYFSQTWITRKNENKVLFVAFGLSLASRSASFVK
jgi:hypothetical protein